MFIPGEPLALPRDMPGMTWKGMSVPEMAPGAVPEILME
jgi:hypothetical protein